MATKAQDAEAKIFYDYIRENPWQYDNLDPVSKMQYVAAMYVDGRISGNRREDEIKKIRQNSGMPPEYFKDGEEQRYILEDRPGQNATMGDIYKVGSYTRPDTGKDDGAFQSFVNKSLPGFDVTDINDAVPWLGDALNFAGGITHGISNVIALALQENPQLADVLRTAGSVYTNSGDLIPDPGGNGQLTLPPVYDLNNGKDSDGNEQIFSPSGRVSTPDDYQGPPTGIGEGTPVDSSTSPLDFSGPLLNEFLANTEQPPQQPEAPVADTTNPVQPTPTNDPGYKFEQLPRHIQQAVIEALQNNPNMRKADVDEIVQEMLEQEAPAAETVEPTSPTVPTAEPIDPVQVVDRAGQDAQDSPDGQIDPAPVVTVPQTDTSGGQTDRTGNPYDPAKEEEYAERNPNYPNPYSLPEGDFVDPAQTDPGGGGGGGSVDPVDAGIDVVQEWLKAQNTRDRLDRAVDKVRAPEPYDMTIPGATGVDFTNGQINFNNTEAFDNLTKSSFERADSLLNDPNIDKIEDIANTRTANSLNGVFNKAINTHSFMPAVNKFNQQTDQNILGQSLLASKFANKDYLGDIGRERDELFKSGQYQNATGQRLIDNAEDYDYVAEKRLGLMRDMADPYEQRAQQSLDNQLFSTGNLGSKGGAMKQGELTMNLQNADRQRILDSQSLADQLRQFDIGAGTDLLAGGTDAFAKGGTLFGLGANADINAGTVASNSLANAGNMINNRLTGNVDGLGAENTRLQQRLETLMKLFNFGQDARADSITNATNTQAIGNANIETLLSMIQPAANPHSYGSNPNSAAANVYANNGTPEDPTGSALEKLLEILT